MNRGDDTLERRLLDLLVRSAYDPSAPTTHADDAADEVTRFEALIAHVLGEATDDEASALLAEAARDAGSRGELYDTVRVVETLEDPSVHARFDRLDVDPTAVLAAAGLHRPAPRVARRRVRLTRGWSWQNGPTWAFAAAALVLLTLLPRGIVDQLSSGRSADEFVVSTQPVFVRGLDLSGTRSGSDEIPVLTVELARDARIFDLTVWVPEAIRPGGDERVEAIVRRGETEVWRSIGDAGFHEIDGQPAVSLLLRTADLEPGVLDVEIRTVSIDDPLRVRSQVRARVDLRANAPR